MEGGLAPNPTLAGVKAKPESVGVALLIVGVSTFAALVTVNVAVEVALV